MDDKRSPIGYFLNVWDNKGVVMSKLLLSLLSPSAIARKAALGSLWHSNANNVFITMVGAYGVSLYYCLVSLPDLHWSATLASLDAKRTTGRPPFQNAAAVAAAVLKQNTSTSSS